MDYGFGENAFGCEEGEGGAEGEAELGGGEEGEGACAGSRGVLVGLRGVGVEGGWGVGGD